jgi:membrane fusion protein, multidrug efflux system
MSTPAPSETTESVTGKSVTPESVTPESAKQESPSSGSASAESSAAKSPGRSRRLGLIGLGAVVALSGLGYLGYWFFDGRFYQSTDDAYVNGDVVQVTSEIPGTVVSLNVDDTQPVRAGQRLLELDPADAKIAEANAEADLARAVRQVRSGNKRREPRTMT